MHVKLMILVQGWCWIPIFAATGHFAVRERKHWLPTRIFSIWLVPPPEFVPVAQVVPAAPCSSENYKVSRSPCFIQLCDLHHTADEVHMRLLLLVTILIELPKALLACHSECIRFYDTNLFWETKAADYGGQVMKKQHV